MQSCSQIVITIQNKPTPNFLQAGCPPVAQPTVSELSTALVITAFQVQTSFVVVCVQMSATRTHDVVMSCIRVSVLTANRGIVSYFVNSFSCCERPMLYCWQNSVTVTPNHIRSHEFVSVLCFLS